MAASAARTSHCSRSSRLVLRQLASARAHAAFAHAPTAVSRRAKSPSSVTNPGSGGVAASTRCRSSAPSSSAMAAAAVCSCTSRQRAQLLVDRGFDERVREAHRSHPDVVADPEQADPRCLVQRRDEVGHACESPRPTPPARCCRTPPSTPPAPASAHCRPRACAEPPPRTMRGAAATIPGPSIAAPAAGEHRLDEEGVALGVGAQPLAGADREAWDPERACQLVDVEGGQRLSRR